MFGVETKLQIFNNTAKRIKHITAKCDPYDWETDDRPDKNINGKSLDAGKSLSQKEVYKQHASYCWFSLNLEFEDGYKTGDIKFSQREANENRYFIHWTSPYYAPKYFIYESADKKGVLTLKIEENTEAGKRDTFTCGKGSVTVVIDIPGLEHSFVYAKSEDKVLRKFHCWGDCNTGVSSSNTLYTLKGNHIQAVCNANLDPSCTNLDLEEVGSSWMNCSGIQYGFTGVCHQMANSVMLSCEGMPLVNERIGGGSLSLFMYGPYGSTHLYKMSGYMNWVQYTVRALIEYFHYKKKEPTKLGSWHFQWLENEFMADYSKLHVNSLMSDMEKEVIDCELQHVDEKDLPVKRLSIIIKHTLGDTVDAEIKESILEKFSELIRRQDYRLERHLLDSGEGGGAMISRETAETINADCAEFLAHCYQLLGELDYQKLFQMEYSKDYRIVDLEYIP